MKCRVKMECRHEYPPTHVLAHLHRDSGLLRKQLGCRLYRASVGVRTVTTDPHQIRAVGSCDHDDVLHNRPRRAVFDIRACQSISGKAAERGLHRRITRVAWQLLSRTIRESEKLRSEEHTSE